MVQVISREDDMYYLKVAEQKLICDQPVTDTYMVSFDLVNEVPKCYISSRWSKNIKRKHTYIKSSHDLQSSVPSRQSSNALENQCAINVDLVLAPPQVSTKGRPSNKRLGAELDKSIRNATRRRKKDSTSDTMDHGK
ncbi:hypothetical protein PIB30_028974 [Stylosanthes scabra]|uniref:Uncharacterized protein n=1 Tax=Stylosanthes scabra TaxID=79078 RepID=A0ABU6VAC5_9FABA|nr:hypothetical protein [Stylosanthes scabra]